MSSLSDQRETVALRAVLGTMIWSGLTLPGLCEALSVLRRDQLDLDDGVLVLTRVPFPAQRFQLDPRSTAMWAWLLLLRVQDPDWQERPDTLVLPTRWQEPKQLRAAIQEIIIAAGLGSWSAFTSAVQLLLVCDGVPPVVVWRRAGHLFTTPEAAPQSPAVRALAADGTSAESGHKMSPPPTRGGASSEFSSPSWRQPVKQIFRGLRCRGTGPSRRQMASDLERLVHEPRWTAEAGILGLVFCQWTKTLLLSSRRRNTVRAYLTRVGRAVDAGLIADAVMSSTSAAEVTACVQRIIELYRTHESRRSVLRTLRAFLVFASEQGSRVEGKVKWQRIARNIGGTTRAEPLLTPAEIQAAAATLRGVEPEGLALAVAVVLGGCGGLRRSEICDLSQDDVQRESDWAIHVRRSKTKAGARRVPLRALAPSWAVEILEAYDAYRATLRSTSRAWLLTVAGTAWSPDAVGERVTRVLKTVSGKPATFHSLRRACATWWLVCWLSHDRGWPLHPVLAAGGVPATGVLAVLGKDPILALWSLARLLGHVVPTVTVDRYFLAIDWVEAQVFAGDPSARLTNRTAADLLVVTDRRARHLVAFHEGSATVDKVLAAQRRRLRLLVGRR